MPIGNKVKFYRLRAHLSQDELAKKVGYTGKSMICRIETGKNNPSFELLEKIAAALNIPPSALLDDDASLLERVAADNGMAEAFSAMARIKDSRTKEFIDLFSQLTESEQDIFLAQIKGVLSSR